MSSAILETLVALAVFAVALSASVNGDRVLRPIKLSDKEHDDAVDHDYDHEAFLGKDQAHEFDELSPEESKRRLGVIVDKIDTNGDRSVSKDELGAWMRKAQQRENMKETERQMEDFKAGEKGVTWEQYKKGTYDPQQDQGEDFDVEKHITRDQEKWKAADLDGNNLLSKDELRTFLHPEESDSLRAIFVKHVMEDIDKNGDDKVSMEEYIQDMHQPQEGETEEPEWLNEERESFTKERDQDGNGYLDKKELANWIMPEGGYIQEEVDHLMSEADANKDGKLTKAEIMEKQDTFVNSQATAYGEDLKRHEEL